tara:strand:- start:1328 stop:1738 length:411 start_codon:yes stop_codon:yes gene_type:complete
MGNNEFENKIEAIKTEFSLIKSNLIQTYPGYVNGSNKPAYLDNKEKLREVMTKARNFYVEAMPSDNLDALLDDINSDKGVWKTSEDKRTKQKTKYLASEFLKTQNYSRRLVLYSQNAYFFISILAMMFFIRKQIKL